MTGVWRSPRSSPIPFFKWYYSIDISSVCFLKLWN
jgi:hypothetical protein